MTPRIFKSKRTVYRDTKSISNIRMYNINVLLIILALPEKLMNGLL